MIYVQIAFILGMLFGGFMVFLGEISGPYLVRLLKLKPKKERGETTIGPMLQETLDKIEKERQESGYYEHREQ